jgi:hypothetical protein
MLKIMIDVMGIDFIALGEMSEIDIEYIQSGS